MTAGAGALAIPADALDAVCDASSGVFRRDLDTALRETAAPLIVAAELRRWADLLAFKTGLIPDREVVASAIEQLRTRADQLDGVSTSKAPEEVNPACAPTAAATR